MSTNLKSSLLPLNLPACLSTEGQPDPDNQIGRQNETDRCLPWPLSPESRLEPKAANLNLNQDLDLDLISSSLAAFLPWSVGVMGSTLP